jgi:expansin (peptidoglycan-binding protein)
MSVMQCRNNSRYMSLSSCTADDPSERRSCVDLYASDLDGAGTGTGSYYDGSGTLFDVVISETEIGLDGLNRETIRTGVMRGTLTPSGSDGPTQPFELTFSACSQALAVCLI